MTMQKLLLVKILNRLGAIEKNDVQAFEYFGGRITSDEAWDAGWVPLKESLTELGKQAETLTNFDTVNGLLREDVARLERERDEALMAAEIAQANAALWKGKAEAKKARAKKLRRAA